jgi:Hydroxymethylpyrimidine/phosphomethylpyrimidine kinase
MADLKTMQERNVFSTAVIVAVTAQNTLGVQDFMALPAKLINEQFASLAADFKIRACKTGMLADAEHVRLVVAEPEKVRLRPADRRPRDDRQGGGGPVSGRRR